MNQPLFSSNIGMKELKILTKILSLDRLEEINEDFKSWYDKDLKNLMKISILDMIRFEENLDTQSLCSLGILRKYEYECVYSFVESPIYSCG